MLRVCRAPSYGHAAAQFANEGLEQDRGGGGLVLDLIATFPFSSQTGARPLPPLPRRPQRRSTEAPPSSEHVPSTQPTAVSLKIFQVQINI
jgi:hypothetical protein